MCACVCLFVCDCVYMCMFVYMCVCRLHVCMYLYAFNNIFSITKEESGGKMEKQNYDRSSVIF